MIQDVNTFIEYLSSIRRRTIRYVRTIPANEMDWSPKAGEMTCGDIVRHLAAAEKMFVGAAVEGKWTYRGHARILAGNLDEAVALLDASHAEAITTLNRMSNADLHQPRPTLDGPPVKAWRLLMALVEHEVHHRSQLAVYLALMGVEPPQIYGLGIEQVVELSSREED